MDGAELQDFIDRYNDAWNAHDVGAIVAMHTEDSVFENHVTGDHYVGREAIRTAIRGIFGVFPDLTFEGRRQYIRKDLVVQEWTARGTHQGAMARGGVEVAPTGRQVEYKGMDVIPIENGLVVSEWTATATNRDGSRVEWDGIDVFPFENGLILRKDVYSSSHDPRVLDD